MTEMQCSSSNRAEAARTFILFTRLCNVNTKEYQVLIDRLSYLPFQNRPQTNMVKLMT